VTTIVNKTEKLLGVAQATLLKGDRETAKEIAVMALTTEDAVDALDKLLPKVPEPEISAEEIELSPNQVGKITALAQELQAQQKHKIASVILAKLERIEERKRQKKLLAKAKK
jgi:hypothetical protein